jgi:RimJ/RimL family protein N-acetyltransferase
MNVQFQGRDLVGVFIGRRCQDRWQITLEIKVVVAVANGVADREILGVSEMSSPKIRKAVAVRGETLVFRDVNLEDAEFILSLRTDEMKSRFLSATSNDLQTQRTWLEGYAKTDNQSYFIIEYHGLPVGTVRLYDPQQDSFCWGSWILSDSRPRQAAMESALMVYAYALDHLGFKSSHFDVRKGNERVWQFHERFGAQRVQETDRDFLYILRNQAIRDSFKRYAKFLPNGVEVEFL